MTTNEKNNIADNTRVDVNEQGETVINPVYENVSAKTAVVNNGMKNVIVGVAGAAAGIGGAILITSSVRPRPTSNAELGYQPVFEPEPEPEPAHFNGADVPVASSVNGNMTFDEAFAAARNELGAGGIFSWHGNTYGTYYADEWDGFSDEYKNAFGSYPYNIEHEAYLADAPLPVEVELIDELLADVPQTDEVELADAPQPVEVAQTDDLLADAPEIVEAELVDPAFTGLDDPILAEIGPANDYSTDEPLLVADAASENDYFMEDIPVISEDDGEVSILNATPIDLEGQDVTLVTTEVDGQDVVLVDVNQDGAYDITVINENGDIEELSVYEIDNDSFLAEQDQTLNDMPVVDDPVYDNPTLDNDLVDINNATDIHNF